MFHNGSFGQQWYENVPDKKNITDEVIKANVEYLKNPRKEEITDYDNLMRVLNMHEMDPVSQKEDGTFEKASNGYMPVEEYTFVLSNGNFHVAPNSSASKFVHPNILGGWTPVESASTLIKIGHHIRVTNDSGHYRPTEGDINIAHTRLKDIIGNARDTKTTAVRKLHWAGFPFFSPKYKKVRTNE